MSCPKASTDPVELIPAAVFVCNECGRRSFTDLIPAENVWDYLSDERRASVLAHRAAGKMPMITPLVVACQHCRTSFPVTLPEAPSLEEAEVEDDDS